MNFFVRFVKSMISKVKEFFKGRKERKTTDDIVRRQSVREDKTEKIVEKDVNKKTKDVRYGIRGLLAKHTFLVGTSTVIPHKPTDPIVDAFHSCPATPNSTPTPAETHFINEKIKAYENGETPKPRTPSPVLKKGARFTDDMGTISSDSSDSDRESWEEKGKEKEIPKEEWENLSEEEAIKLALALSLKDLVDEVVNDSISDQKKALKEEKREKKETQRIIEARVDGRYNRPTDLYARQTMIDTELNEHYQKKTEERVARVSVVLRTSRLGQYLIESGEEAYNYLPVINGIMEKRAEAMPVQHYKNCVYYLMHCLLVFVPQIKMLTQHRQFIGKQNEAKRCTNGMR